jgi:hypothetical protein
MYLGEAPNARAREERRGMNTAQDKLRARLEKLTDHDVLELLVENSAIHDLSDGERAAFANMRANLFDSFGEAIRGRTLSTKQRRWALDVLERVTPISASDVPRGKEVLTPAVLKNLPKKPPGRST